MVDLIFTFFSSISKQMTVLMKYRETLTNLSKENQFNFPVWIYLHSCVSAIGIYIVPFGYRTFRPPGYSIISRLESESGVGSGVWILLAWNLE